MDMTSYTDLGISYENSNARLYYRYDEDAENIELVKVWTRTPNIDDTLIRELWSHELRYLNKLQLINGIYFRSFTPVDLCLASRSKLTNKHVLMKRSNVRRTQRE